MHTFEFVTTAMSTTVSVQIVGEIAGVDTSTAEALAAEALDWFRMVEACCSRFDAASELVQLCAQVGTPVPVSPLLFEILRVALAVAQATHGAFDFTLGAPLHAMGFDRHWQTGQPTAPSLSLVSGDWRRLQLDEASGTVLLPSPMLLDLGGVAKGFAIDLAGRALAAVNHLCIVAGGDLLCRGLNGNGTRWRTAIRHPFDSTGAAAVLEVDAPEFAVCTSGGYARRSARGHHLLDARGGDIVSAERLASATVVAPQAAIADALATAAFVLGADEATALLQAQEVDAYLIGRDGTPHVVSGWGRTLVQKAS